MRIPRIFVDAPLAEQQSLPLPTARAHYVRNVLRLQVDQPLRVFNGEGGEYQATLSSVSKKQVSINIDRYLDAERESPLHTELAIGVSKGDRMDWIVQKATELGVNVVTPLITERSEVKLNTERWQKKHKHWREVSISACEQCERNRLPQIEAVKTLTTFLESSSATKKFILHPINDTQNFADQANREKVDDAVLLVGPEGGFSEAEFEQAQQAGFTAWALGERILRTETAPVVALSILQYQWGDYN